MTTSRALTAAAAAIAAFAVAGCGGGENGADTAVEAPPLTVPGYSGTPKVTKREKAPGADSVKKTTTQASVGAESDTPTQTEATTAEGGQQGTDHAAHDASAPSGGNTSDGTSTGGASAQFQEFCANNAGAC